MTEAALRRVVIADDDADVLGLLSEYLGGDGWQVFEAMNGLEALLHVKRQRPHAVLLDLRMPRLGGIETLKRIRTFDPAIRVVILSGNLDTDVRRQVEAIGAAAVLGKPVDLRAVRAALDGVRPTPADAPTPSASAPTVVAAPASSRTVLAVDGDADIRALLEASLAANGYLARSAGDGAAAVRALVAAPVDVILLDIDTVGLDGAALPALRAVAPRAAILVITGSMNEHMANRVLAAGAFDYVIKPIDMAHLLDAIETALAMHDIAL